MAGELSEGERVFVVQIRERCECVGCVDGVWRRRFTVVVRRFGWVLWQASVLIGGAARWRWRRGENAARYASIVALVVIVIAVVVVIVVVTVDISHCHHWRCGSCWRRWLCRRRIDDGARRFRRKWRRACCFWRQSRQRFLLARTHCSWCRSRYRCRWLLFVNCTKVIFK